MRIGDSAAEGVHAPKTRRQKHPGFEGLSRLLLRASFVLAFLSLPLLSLNAFPYGCIEGLYPERPAYLVSLLGLICYAASLRWTSQVREHVPLLVLVGAFLLYGLVVTELGLIRLEQLEIAPFILFQYLKRKVIPALYILWFAFLLSPLPKQKARRFFLAALLAMFLPNALHMIMELLANAGLQGMKDFLIGINPWFRQENTSHGMWPPPYFTDRVRGLFAEPSHLAYALTPVLAFFFYKVRSNLAYVLPLLLVAFAFTGRIPTLTGLISLLFLSAAFLFDWLRARKGLRVAVLAILLSSVTAAAGLSMAALEKGMADTLGRELALAEDIADYCRMAQKNSDLPPPQLNSAGLSRIFTRLVCLRIEMDIALQHPWGTGFSLSGFYWKPLLVWSDQKLELFIWVRDAFANVVPVIPHLCEYTALAAEGGFPGLCLFFLLCGYIALRCWKRSLYENDPFLLYMLFALGAFLLIFLAVALKSGFMFYYFLGFLYAEGRKPVLRPACAGVRAKNIFNAMRCECNSPH